MLTFTLWAAIIGALIYFLRPFFRIVYTVFKAAQAQANAYNTHAQRQKQQRKPNVAPPSTLVTCAYCQVHIPQSEAVQDGRGAYFCSTEHRDVH